MKKKRKNIFKKKRKKKEKGLYNPLKTFEISFICLFVLLKVNAIRTCFFVFRHFEVICAEPEFSKNGVPEFFELSEHFFHFLFLLCFRKRFKTLHFFVRKWLFWIETMRFFII